MPRRKSKSSAKALEHLLDEASWLLSHAQALADYGRQDEADAERARAAVCEEQVAILLEAKGEELEAAIHRVSAATCYQKLGEFSRAVTLLHAAQSVTLPKDFRSRVSKQLADCLAAAQKELEKLSIASP